MNRHSTLIAVFVAGLLVVPAPVLAAAEPNFEAYAPQDTLVPGQPAKLTVQLVNDAEDGGTQVQTATNVEAEIKGRDVPFEVRSGTTYLGTMPDGKPAVANFSLFVPSGVESGTYDVPVYLTYEYGSGETETTTADVEVRVADRPVFEVTNSRANLPVGESGTVELTVENVGSDPAEQAVLTTRSMSPDVRFQNAPEASAYLGDLDPGDSTTVTFDATAAPTADARSYVLASSVTYETEDGTPGQFQGMHSGVSVAPEQDFSVSNLSSSLRVGEQQSVTATIANDGPRTVENAVVQFAPRSEIVRPAQTRAAVGDLEPNETARVTFPVAVAPEAEAGRQPVAYTVTYEDRHGATRASDPLTAQVSVAPKRDRFALEGVESDLRVGDDGDLSFDLVNRGASVRDAEVRLVQTGPRVYPRTTGYALGDVAADALENVTFSIAVSDEAEPTPRQFAFQVVYETEAGDQRQTRPIQATVAVAPEQSQFDVHLADSNVTAGSSALVRVEITNLGDEPVSDVNAKAFSNDPITVDDDRAFLGTLDPGETATATFKVSAGAGAVEKTYPVSVDFQYDTADGDTKLSDTHDVPVAVEDAGRGLPATWLALGGVGVLTALGLGVWWRRN